MFTGNGEALMSVVLVLGYTTLGILALCAVNLVYKTLQSRSRHDISGQWVVVTGCDSGIGQGVVTALSKTGQGTDTRSCAGSGSRSGLRFGCMNEVGNAVCGWRGEGSRSRGRAAVWAAAGVPPSAVVGRGVGWCVG